MRLDISMLPKDRLLHLFDIAARADNKILAMQVVKELADRNHISVEDQIRKLGQRASKIKNTISFQMVSKLWNGR